MSDTTPSSSNNHPSTIRVEKKHDLSSELYTLLRKNWRVIISALCAIIFISLTLSVLQGEIMKLDQTAYWLIVEHMRRTWITPIMLDVWYYNIYKCY